MVDGEAAADVLKVLVATAGRRQLLPEGTFTCDVRNEGEGWVGPKADESTDRQSSGRSLKK